MPQRGKWVATGGKIRPVRTAHPALVGKTWLLAHPARMAPSLLYDAGNLVTTVDFASLLADRRDEIVARFIAELQRTDIAPPGIPQPKLVDHIPRFLDVVAREVAGMKVVRLSLDAVNASAVAREHGEQRWSLGYDLEGLIREYGVLRHCILGVAKELDVQFSVDEFDVLAKCLSDGVTAAATEYVKYRDGEFDAQKAKLEFLTEAGQILSSSLDYHATLGTLTGVLVPRLADWCAVHLEPNTSKREMPISHVDPTKIDLLRKLYAKYPTPVDAPWGYETVLRTGKPQLFPDVDIATLATSDEQQRAWLREIGTCSWMVVPLHVQGTVLGALTLAYSDSNRHYDASDLILVGELARSAAAAIDRARLYDLSQAERARVETATRAKDEFVAMVSHELRTPLHAILGWLRLMRASSFDDTKRAHAFDVIERNAEAQNKLVSDLLDISRIITGKLRINPSQLEFASVIDMAIEGVRPAAEAKRIQIAADLERESSVLRGDGDRLQQVVWNLLANAVKFTPKGGVVRIRLRRVESDVELVVEDNGQGIEPSFLPHVFETFRQSDVGTARSYGGLGIGLSIAKHIVELHGGSIVATSAGQGRGSEFVVRLPISPLVSTTMGVARVRATQQYAASALPTGLERISVLVVDDEVDARELLTYVFESCGMEVRVASSGSEALQVLTQYTPAVIVSDVGMADEDGYALIRIRTLADERKRETPAIALTAFARNEDRTRALVEGFNVHMIKPVEPAALVQAVIELAATHERRTGAGQS